MFVLTRRHLLSLAVGTAAAALVPTAWTSTRPIAFTAVQWIMVGSLTALFFARAPKKAGVADSLFGLVCVARPRNTVIPDFVLRRYFRARVGHLRCSARIASGPRS